MADKVLFPINSAERTIALVNEFSLKKHLMEGTGTQVSLIEAFGTDKMVWVKYSTDSFGG